MMLVHKLKCPRCGHTHEQVMFRRLANMIDKFEWYMICAVTQQPVLLRPLSEEESHDATTPQRSDYLNAEDISFVIAHPDLYAKAPTYGTIAG
jgi:hypothetical protein